MQFQRRKRLALCFITILTGFAGVELLSAAPGGGSIASYESRYFLVHSDLPAGAARQRIVHLEATLVAVSEYWGQPLDGRIECYLVHNPAVWPAESLPYALAHVLLQRVGGRTDAVRASKHDVRARGRQAPFRARILALTTPGVAEHEVAHAYCCQVFGWSGPDWYKEGMAEVASQHGHRTPEVRCSEAVVARLRRTSTRDLSDVVSGADFTAPITALFDRLATDAAAPDGTAAPGHCWTAKDDGAVQYALESYASSWAFCHLMIHHPDYRYRFRRLGRAFLLRQDVCLRTAFGDDYDRIAFEYEFFLQHVQPGYRVDLCDWEWDKPCAELRVGRSARVVVTAARGFQPAGIAVTRGGKYDFCAQGKWATEKKGRSLSAAGDAAGRGRLEGVVVNDYRLSDYLDLGADGFFTAPTSGQLYLRCRDAWNELADNAGRVVVELRRGDG